MTRRRLVFCNLGFTPGKQLFRERPDLIPPHTQAFEEALPCIPVAGSHSIDENVKSGEKGIPGLAVSGSDPAVPAKMCQGNPCVPGTGEKLVAETDFEFAGHSFGRTYRSLRKGRSYGFIDDNWTHSWSTRILTGALGGGSSNLLMVSTATGDIEGYAGAAEGEFRNTSRTGIILKTLPPAGSNWRWQLLSDNGDYQNFDNDGRLIELGNLRDKSQRLTFTYLFNVHPLDWGWWAIKDATDVRGRKLRFEYDVNKTYQPRLLKIVLASDPAATPATLVEYKYWEQDQTNQVFWRLKEAIYPDGRLRHYVYGDRPGEQTNGLGMKHYLTGILLGTAPNSTPIRYATYRYDSFGRVIESHHGGDTLKAGRVELAYIGEDGNPSNDDEASSQVRVTHARVDGEAGSGNVRTFSFPKLGISAEHNGLHLASNVGDTAGTVSYTYQASHAAGCSSTAAENDWRRCTVKDGRGYVTLYEYDGSQLIRVTEGLRADLSATPEARTTATDWLAASDGKGFGVVAGGLPSSRRVCAGKVACAAGGAWPTLQSQESWVYDSVGRVTSHCRYDVSVIGATSYVCGGESPPESVRQTSYTYCGSGQSGCSASSAGFLHAIVGPNGLPDDITIYDYYTSTDESGCGTADGACFRAGDLYSITSPNSLTITIEKYDSRGRPIWMTDANLIRTVMEYDLQGRLKSRRIVGPNGAADATTGISYVPETGLVNVVTQPDGSYVDYDYDAALRVTAISDNLGNRQEFKRDIRGNALVERTFEGSVLRRRLAQQYDLVGRLLRQRDALDAAGAPLAGADINDPTKGRQVAEYTYDANGNRTQTLDGLLRDTDQEYDALNRLKLSLDALRPDCWINDAYCGRTAYAYDAADRLTQVRDPRGLPTNHTVDGLGDIDTLESTDTGTTTYKQDRAGNRTEKTDARGVRSVYAYDGGYRLRSVTYPLGNSARNAYYYYDETNAATGCVSSYPRGRLTRMVDASGSTTYCYDHRGNVTSKRQIVTGKSDMVVAYTYTVADRLASVTYPGATPQTVSYGRDTVGRVNSISVNGTSFISAVSYYAWGPVRSITYANGGNPQTLTKTYDANYAIDAISSTRLNGLNIDYTVDVTGNIKQLQQATSTRVLEYDLLDRLRQVTTGTQPIDTYGYDAVGNRVTAQAGSGVMRKYGYTTTSHRLVDIDNVNRLYDNAGNTILVPTLPMQSFSYDESNRLVAAMGPSEQDLSIEYNGRGERVFKEIIGGGSIVSEYLYNEAGATLVFRDSNSSSRTPRFRHIIYLDQLPVGLIDNGALMQIETDHLGTPRAVSNGSTVVWRWELVSGTTTAGGSNAFGDQPPNEDVDGNGTPYTFDLRFPGQIYDPETKLHYNYFRDYEPGTGRYVESDPIGLRGGMSTYGYAESNPFVFLDYFGLQVHAAYDVSNGTLSVTNISTGENVTTSASSGGRPIGAPIPPGVYDILDHPDVDYLRLEPVDDPYGDDATEGCLYPEKGTCRRELRLHHRGRGNTTGCISVGSDADWIVIRDMIRGYRGSSTNVFSKSKDPRSSVTEEVNSFGWLEVTD